MIGTMIRNDDRDEDFRNEDQDDDQDEDFRNEDRDEDFRNDDQDDDQDEERLPNQNLERTRKTAPLKLTICCHIFRKMSRRKTKNQERRTAIRKYLFG